MSSNHPFDGMNPNPSRDQLWQQFQQSQQQQQQFQQQQMQLMQQLLTVGPNPLPQPVPQVSHHGYGPAPLQQSEPNHPSAPVIQTGSTFNQVSPPIRPCFGFSATAAQAPNPVHVSSDLPAYEAHHVNNLVPHHSQYSSSPISPAIARLPGGPRLNTAALRPHGRNVNIARTTSATASNSRRGRGTGSRAGSNSINDIHGENPSASRRTRGPAPPVPALPLTSVGRQVVPKKYKIRLVLYAPFKLSRPQTKQVVLSYRFRELLLRQEYYDLTHTYELDGQMSIQELFQNYFDTLASSTFNYQFKSLPVVIPDPEGRFPNSSLPIRLLVVSNHGRMHADGNKYFKPYNIPDNITSVQQLCEDEKVRYGPGGISIYDDHLIIRVQPKSVPFGPVIDGHRHIHCFRRRLDHLFIHDDDTDMIKANVQKARGENVPNYLDNDEELTTCGEESDEGVGDDNDDDDNDESFWDVTGDEQTIEQDPSNIFPAPTMHSTQHVEATRDVINNQHPAVAVISSTSDPTWAQLPVFNPSATMPQPPLPPIIPLPILPSLQNLQRPQLAEQPQHLFSTPFTPKSIDLPIVECRNIAVWLERLIPALAPEREASKDLYLVASLGEINRNVCGSALDILGQKFVDEVGKSLLLNDFTHFFAPGRLFEIEYAKDEMSMGNGLKVETLTRLSGQFLKDESYFNSRRGGYYTLTVQGDASTIHLIGEERLHHFEVLGAIVALHLTWHGILMDGVSPFLIQYLVNDFDISSITEGLLQRFDPETLADIKTWRELGPAGNIMSHANLVEYCCNYSADAPAAHRGRTQEYHSAYEATMLTNILFGKYMVKSAELRAFKKGFDLPCTNGIPLSELMHAYHGGSEVLITHALENYINSGEAIRQHITVHSHPSLEERLNQCIPNHVQHTFGSVDPFESLLMDYFNGVGEPGPGVLDYLIKELPNMQLLHEKIQHPGFRARAFYRAVTGSDRILPGVVISVDICCRDFAGYHSDLIVRTSMYKKGVFSFKTCSASVYIPGEQFLGYMKNYRTSRKQALEDLHTWIFVQTVGCDSVHTMS